MQHLLLKSWRVAFNALRWIKNSILMDGNTQVTDKLCTGIGHRGQREIVKHTLILNVW